MSFLIILASLAGAVIITALAFFAALSNATAKGKAEARSDQRKVDATAHAKADKVIEAPLSVKDVENEWSKGKL